MMRRCYWLLVSKRFSMVNCADSMWAFTGKQCWRCGVNRERTNHVRVRIHFRTHKGCQLLVITGRWSWRLISAEECVTTHRSKRPAPKTNDAKVFAHSPWSPFCVRVVWQKTLWKNEPWLRKQIHFTFHTSPEKCHALVRWGWWFKVQRFCFSLSLSQCREPLNRDVEEYKGIVSKWWFVSLSLLLQARLWHKPKMMLPCGADLDCSSSDSIGIMNCRWIVSEKRIRCHTDCAFEMWRVEKDLTPTAVGREWVGHEPGAMHTPLR